MFKRFILTFFIILILMCPFVLREDHSSLNMKPRAQVITTYKSKYNYAAQDHYKREETKYLNNYLYISSIFFANLEGKKAQAAKEQADKEAAARKEQASKVNTNTTNKQAPVYTPSGSTGVDWDAIANCETGGNWGMIGSTFSGGVGFANTTWNGFGGQEFASMAGYASREQQIIVAERVYARYGLSGWGCKAYG